jgi:hypothetical protein
MNIFGQEYIGDNPATETVYHHASTLDKNMVLENAVLAGPVSFTNTVISNWNIGNRINE